MGITPVANEANSEIQAQPIGDFLTIEEAVRISGYTGQYLRRMARRGRIQAVKRGHFWLINSYSLEAYMASASSTSDRRFGPREVNRDERSGQRGSELMRADAAING